MPIVYWVSIFYRVRLMSAYFGVRQTNAHRLSAGLASVLRVAAAIKGLKSEGLSHEVWSESLQEFLQVQLSVFHVLEH